MTSFLQSCAVCVNFQPPSACKFVDGIISPNGWCQSVCCEDLFASRVA